MALVMNEGLEQEFKDNETEVRNLVMAGVKQAEQGKVKDFNSVCERLKKKYRDEIL